MNQIAAEQPKPTPVETTLQTPKTPEELRKWQLACKEADRARDEATAACAADMHMNLAALARQMQQGAGDKDEGVTWGRFGDTVKKYPSKAPADVKPANSWEWQQDGK